MDALFDVPEPPQEPHVFKRREIREKVLQALYAYEISREPITDVVGNVFGDLKNSKDDFEFAKKLVMEVLYHEDEVEGIIKRKVAHWEFDRIALIDKLLLRMGICEMLYFPDIPPKVTINELIEVAKSFSTENSGRFINGVLDAVLEDLRKAHSLRKAGRGLVNRNLSAPEDPTPPEEPVKQPSNVPPHPYKKPFIAPPYYTVPPRKKPKQR